MRLLLLRSAFNRSVVEGLADGARCALLEAGADADRVGEHETPGAFELPLAALVAARSGRWDAVIALGAVIRGETDHYEHIAREAAAGLAAVSRQTGVPVALGVLTVDDAKQARKRCVPGPDNKGAEAARAAVTMVHLLRQLAPRPPARRPGRPRRRR